MRNFFDDDRDTILKDLPSEESAHHADYKPGSGWFPVPPANAWACWIDTPTGKRLEVWPVSGGYLVA